jgi:hypothetical protein
VAVLQKKLQVFVSSTYADLKDERQAAVAGILLAKHIPAGMELFTAGDEAQWDVIRRWIQDSDVYMLILGARYGSIEPRTGQSYTELEYDYAAQLGKPAFAVVMADFLVEARLPTIAPPEPPEAREAYGRFRSKVLSKISTHFENGDQIKLAILSSLGDIEARPHLGGWIRANEMPSVQPLVEEIGRLQNDRQMLLDQLAARPIAIDDEGKVLAGLDDPITLELKFKVKWDHSTASRPIATTWREVYAIAAPLFVEYPNDRRVSSTVATALYKRRLGGEPYEADVGTEDWGTVRTQFQALGLVELKYQEARDNSMYLYWYVTDAGKKLALTSRAVYKAATGGA